jgi:hypothetical protein
VVPVANNVQPPRVVPATVPVPVPVPVANNVHRLRTKEQLCDYHHRAAGHLVKKTWLAAIKAGEYATWPGLTYELVSNHLYDTEETAMGHLHKRRQDIRSTKIKPKPIPVQNTIEDLEPELQGQFFIDRIPVMAVILRSIFGVLFLRGSFSLKNWFYRPLLRDSTSPFKGTCLFIKLKEDSVAK